jgi:hypothetical protein
MSRLAENNLKDRKYLFSDLKPGDRIYKVIKTYVFPDLEEIGFKMNKSTLTISRHVGDFIQEIDFQKNKWNKGNEVVSFSVSFSVKLKTYEKWHEHKYGTASVFAIGHERAKNIQKWTKKHFEDGWYDLAKIDNHEIVKTLKINVIKKGIPYLNVLSSLQGAIDFTIGQNRYYKAPMLFDLALMLNDKSQAQKILSWFNEFKDNSGKKFREDTLKDIEIRKMILDNCA